MTTAIGARVRVLVVDDSAFARKVMREVLESDRRFEVVGTARDGLDALEKVTELQPDVMTLDLTMPNLDGVGVLHALPKLSLPFLPRVVVVTMADDSSEVAVAALQSGAIALVRKPTALATDRLFELSEELREAVATAAVVRAPVHPPRAAQVASAAPFPRRRLARRVVVIGASTGGPQALTLLLGQLPKDFPVPIAIVLHMPVGYTDALARRLDQASAIEVVEAFEGVELLPGRAVVARAGLHLRVSDGAPPNGRLDLLPIDKPHRPAVDVLFESAASAFGKACVAVVLTGMGQDGLLGARAVKAANGIVLTEAESSCIVYGMPRAVKEAGMSDGEAPLERMSEEIQRRLA